jgi:hypothetical protein
VGTCDHVLSCQALNAAIYRGPGSGGAYPVLKAPGRGCEESGHVLSWGGGGMRQTGLIGGKILPAHGYQDRGKC